MNITQTEKFVLTNPPQFVGALIDSILRSGADAHLRAEDAESMVLDLAGAILDFLAANGMDGPVFPEPGSTPASRAEKALRKEEMSAYAKMEASLHAAQRARAADPRRCTCPDWMEGPHQMNESCPMNFPIPKDPTNG